MLFSSPPYGTNQRLMGMCLFFRVRTSRRCRLCVYLDIIASLFAHPSAELKVRDVEESKRVNANVQDRLAQRQTGEAQKEDAR